MDLKRSLHTTQSRLKQSLTPIWTPEMGRRLLVARKAMLRRQEDLATLLSTPGKRVYQQQIDKVESGNLDRLNVSWARLEAVLGKHTAYVLTGRDSALYNLRLISERFYDYFQRAMRKGKKGPDPKKGECPPWPATRLNQWRISKKKRGSTQ